MNITGLPASFDAYIRHGWSLVPIPPGSKGPRTPGWNKRENCLASSAALPEGWGVGLAHAYSGTMALDIDDYEQAKTALTLHGIDLDKLFSSSDAVSINSGNPGHGKLIYAMPFGMTLPSKKIVINGKTIYELRCATAEGLTVQDVLPPSRHPSGTTYQWAGKGRWEYLPTIPSELLDLWQSILTKDSEKSIPLEGIGDVSIEEIRSALAAIDPSCPRQVWIEVGMALHSTEHPDAFMIWNEWSSPSDKYIEREMPSQWRSFKDKDGGITIATLYHHAAEAGWKRPTPDVSHLFAQVTPTAPANLIEGLVTPPPTLNLELIPDPLRSRALEVAQSMAADPLVPIWAGLGAICAAADARIRLRLMGDWLMPPVLWLMTVGSPSAKKTPASIPMLEPLSLIEKEDYPRYKAELDKFEALDAAYASSKKAYLAAAASPEFLLNPNTNELPPLVAQPTPPTQLRFTVSDITSQKLIRMAADRPRGILAYLDEMKAWADKVSDKTSGENRSTWTRGYNATSETFDRVGDGTIMVEHFALSIFGNMQPRVLKSHIDGLTTDGLLQRFIFCILRDEYSDKKNDPSIPQVNKPVWEQLIRQIYALPVAEYSLTNEAYEVFRSFQDWHLTLKRDERINMAKDAYIDALGKLDGLCGRLILCYHLMLDPYSPYVAGKTAYMACELVKTYIAPSLRYTLGDIGGIEIGSLDHWVADHIMLISGDCKQISLSELRRSARRQVAKLNTVMADTVLTDAMSLLEQNGWVALVESNRKTTQWAINPALSTIDREHRASVIEARQRIYDHIHEASVKHGGTAPRRIIRQVA